MSVCHLGNASLPDHEDGITDQLIKSLCGTGTSNFCKKILATNSFLSSSLCESWYPLLYRITSQRSHFENKVSDNVTLGWAHSRMSLSCSHQVLRLGTMATQCDPREREESFLTLCSSTGVGDMISFISCFIFLRVTDFLPTSEGRVLLRVVWL